MIQVGYEYESVNVAGTHFVKKDYFHAEDIHEAARQIRMVSRSNSFWSTMIRNAYFHDTETKRTWEVDSYGHTKGEYFTESDLDFLNRY